MSLDLQSYTKQSRDVSVRFEFRTSTYAKDDGRFLAAMMNDGKVKVLNAGK